MTKYIGFGILSLMAFAWGWERAAVLRKKTRRIDDYLDLLRYIRAQIACFARPVGDILESYHSEAFSANDFNGRSLTNMISTDAYLFSDIKETLSAFAEQIGSGTRDESVRLCDFTITELEEAAARYEKEYPGKSRLWRTLPLLAGLSLMILLL